MVTTRWGDWLEIEDVTEFAIDPKYPEWAGFDHKLSGLMPGQYELRAIPFDQAGKAGAGVGHEFTVLSVSEEQHLSERVKRAITQAMNLDAYHPDILALTEQWVVSVRHGESPEALAQQLGGTVLEPTGHIPNTYVWKFDGDTDTYDIAAAMKQVSGIEFAYPLVDLPIDLHSTPWHLQNTGQTGVSRESMLGLIWLGRIMGYRAKEQPLVSSIQALITTILIYVIIIKLILVMTLMKIMTIPVIFSPSPQVPQTRHSLNRVRRLN